MRIGPHDLAVCSWSLPPAGLRELAESVSGLGLSHIQLALGPFIPADPAQPHADLADLRNSGLAITAGMIAFPGEDYASLPKIRATGGFLPDGTWESRRDLTLAAGKLARELGITLISVHAGFIPTSDHADYPKMLKRITELATGVSEFGVTLALETGQETASELLQFLNDLPARNVAVNFDPANMILYGSGDPIDAINILDRHIRHVHIKDAVASDNPGADWGHVMPVGSGQVDFSEMLGALSDIDYIGPLAIEQDSARRSIPEIQSAIEYLRDLSG
jgi:L-ribulose-5-phosphate 3-epimerase